MWEKLPEDIFRPWDEKLTYDESKSLCKSICSDIYFPSTLKENNELRLLLDDIGRTQHIDVETWLKRIIFK